MYLYYTLNLRFIVQEFIKERTNCKGYKQVNHKWEFRSEIS